MGEKVDEAVKTIVATINSHQNCQTEIDYLKDAKKKLELEIVECNNNNSKNRAEMEKKFQDLKVMSGSIMKEEMAEHKKKSNKFLDTLIKKHHALEKEKTETEKELHELKKENVALRSKVGCFENINSNECQQIVLLEKHNRVYGDENKMLEERLTRLDEKLSTISDANNVLRDEIKVLRDENKVLRDEINNLREHLYKIEDDVLNVNESLSNGLINLHGSEN